MSITISEVQFMAQVTELAELRGWQWVHFRPGRTAHGWRTPVSGPLGKGWPDLFLIRAKDRRIIFAELKKDGALPTPEQRIMLDLLEEVTSSLVHHTDNEWEEAPVEVWLWRPQDWPMIEMTLK